MPIHFNAPEIIDGNYSPYIAHITKEIILNHIIIIMITAGDVV